MNLFYFIGMSLNVLFLGEIVGRAGIACLNCGPCRHSLSEKRPEGPEAKI